LLITNQEALVNAAERKTRKNISILESQHLSRIVEETAKLVSTFPELFKTSDSHKRGMNALSKYPNPPKRKQELPKKPFRITHQCY
jgi:hypothetical protein